VVLGKKGLQGPKTPNNWFTTTSEVIQTLIAGMIPDLLWSMDWKRLLAYITGSVDQELQTRNEYLAEENRILRNQIQGRLRASFGPFMQVLHSRPFASFADSCKGH
jgi:C-terminal processing protease CtpA/Prc